MFQARSHIVVAPTCSANKPHLLDCLQVTSDSQTSRVEDRPADGTSHASAREKGTAYRLCHLRSEFVGGGGEDFGVGVDVGFGGGGGHEGHVVERREEDAAVEGVEVEEALEFEIGGSGGFSAVAGRFCGESIFGAGAEADYIPGEACGAEISPAA